MKSGLLDTTGASVSKRCASASPARLKHILLATDLSEAAQCAFPCAIQLGEDFGARITLLHVVPAPLPPDISHLGIVFAQKVWATQAAKELIELRSQAFPPLLSVETTVLLGSPAHEIVQFATRMGIDLIVLSTHGYSGLKHAWLGSTAETVVQHAPCPVLLVRRKQEKDW